MKKYFYLLLFLTVFNACNKDQDNIDLYDRAVLLTNKQDSFLRLIPRKAEEPIILSKYDLANTKGLRSTASRSVIDPLTYVGYSYNFKGNLEGNPRDVLYPVIDLPKLKEDPICKEYLQVRRLGTTSVKSYSFTNFDRYLQTANVNDKFDMGFELNLIFFKIGKKDHYERAFNNTNIIESNRVYGSLKVLSEQYLLNLYKSENAKKRMREGYLHPMFLDELYNLPPKQLIDNYGAFVLTGSSTVEFF